MRVEEEPGGGEREGGSRGSSSRKRELTWTVQGVYHVPGLVPKFLHFRSDIKIFQNCKSPFSSMPQFEELAWDYSHFIKRKTVKKKGQVCSEVSVLLTAR